MSYWPLVCMNKKIATSKLNQSLDSNGSVEHWHITSGKCLHAIHNESNQLYALDYRQDGAVFATAGKDCAVRLKSIFKILLILNNYRFEYTTKLQRRRLPA